MTLEEQIVSWSQSRPAWQQKVMRRTAAGELFSEKDYDQLAEDVVKDPSGGPATTLAFGHFPIAGADKPQVRLLSISNPKHVNALASETPLTFVPDGMTIVYGDNGSGKSGYARLLKRITRARQQEDILSDVFRDTEREVPTADLCVQIGQSQKALSWPEDTLSELQCMFFYDSACGNAYISEDYDFPYRPLALFVMDGLIKACDEVRKRLEAKLVENQSRSAQLPAVSDEVANTEVGRFLNTLSSTSSVIILDGLLAGIDTSIEAVENAKKEEARLLSTDTSKERQALIRRADKLETLSRHIKSILAVLGAEGLRACQVAASELNTLNEAVRLLSQSFESEPLRGVGSSPWRELWESARRFSEECAYPWQTFPVVDDDSRCVLCQQTFDQDARERIARFNQFVQEDTQVRLVAAKKRHDERVETLNELVISPGIVASNLGDLEASYPQLVADARVLLDRYSKILEMTRDALTSTSPFPTTRIEPAPITTRLLHAANRAREEADKLSNPGHTSSLLATATARRKELELLEQVKRAREAIAGEIERRQEREALEAAKNAAATGPITKKASEFSEQSITEVVLDAFTQETKWLRLEHVTIARTRAEKGTLLHQPKLVGAQQEVKLPRVFSEGERTALGLAAFFTEAYVDHSKSAIILDDPVTSLDHIRRELVATRLAALAESRQVVVFTHDVAFVADLKREATGRGVLVAERSVTRNRAAERKPGVCSAEHPWKAKDVVARLNELGKGLGRIKAELKSWDDNTYENEVAGWAGHLSETWERIISQEIIGPVLAEGGLEVRPNMVKVLARFSQTDYEEFEASYRRVSQWAKRHDKSVLINYVPPEIIDLETELDLVKAWLKRIKGYKS